MHINKGHSWKRRVVLVGTSWMMSPVSALRFLLHEHPSDPVGPGAYDTDPLVGQNRPLTRTGNCTTSPTSSASTETSKFTENLFGQEECSESACGYTVKHTPCQARAGIASSKSDSNSSSATHEGRLPDKPDVQTSSRNRPTLLTYSYKNSRKRLQTTSVNYG